MKQFLLFACLFVSTLSLSAQVFVDIDATGSGDGTTWADAYTNLNDALLAAPAASQVWIAEGTYVTPDSVSFFIDKELTVRGGFQGVETEATEADPALHETILSGDFAGNDVTGVYDSMTALDNNRVLFITDTSSVSSKFVVTLDGMTITNGKVAADFPGMTSFVPFAGGGIFSFARLDASRLKFTDNRASVGSAITISSATAQGSVFDDITLEDNTSETFRQIYVDGVEDLVIRNSTFNGKGQTKNSGFIQLAGSQDILIENCSFSDLDAGASVGAGVSAFNCDDVLLKDCTFDKMKARRGAAFYAEQEADLTIYEQSEDDFVMEGCTVTNGEVSERAGAIVGFDTNIKIVDSDFTDNTAGSIGGVVYHVSTDTQKYVMVMENVTMTNSSDQGAGGAVVLLTFGRESIDITLNNSTFTNNTTNNSGRGGAFYLQGLSRITTNNCVFEKGQADIGGAVYAQSGLLQMEFNNTKFLENGTGPNVSPFIGAAICGLLDDTFEGIFIDSSEFKSNVTSNRSGTISGGAAIYMQGGTSVALPLSIKNSTFQANAASDGSSGGAIYTLFGFDVDIDNCDFLANSAGGDGGALNFDVRTEFQDTDGDNDTITTYNPFSLDITDSRFYDQTASNQGGALSTQRAVANISNSVFVNNTVSENGGGAIIFNGTAPGFDADGNLVNVGNRSLDGTLVHNTFIDNFKGSGDAAVGTHIALFQPGDTNSSDSNSLRLTLLNNIFFLSEEDVPAIEFEPGADEPEGFVPVGDLFVESLGGNFYNNEILDFDIADSDILSEDSRNAEDLFVDPEGNENDLYVVELNTENFDTNPLINSAVISALSPVEDILGNPRGDAPDIGAYETDQATVGTDQPIEDSGLEITFFPNPTADVVNIRNTDAGIAKFQVIMTDATGRVLKGTSFNGTDNQLDLTNLPAGVYNLQLFVNGGVYSKQLVKQ